MFLDSQPDSPLKAIDFGISVFCRPGQYVDVRAGTPIYIAPEVGGRAAGSRVRQPGPRQWTMLNHPAELTLRLADALLARGGARAGTSACDCLCGPADSPASGSPQQVLRMKYTLSADIWSLGIVSYQLLTGRLPFSGEEGQDVSEVYMQKQVGVAFKEGRWDG